MVDKKDIKAWYNQKHRSEGVDAWRPLEAYPIFLDHLNIKSGKKLLDIGCGTGHLLKAAAGKELQTYGIDISARGVEIAREVSPSSQIMLGKAENLPFPDHFFDYVVCLGALEHFMDLRKGLKEMIRVGNQNASFCILVPNKSYLYWRLKGSQGTKQQQINEHLLSLDEWKKLFDSEGLEISTIYQDSWPAKRTKVFSSANPLGMLKRLVYKLGYNVLPLRYTYQFIFILKKQFS
jgi:ubiquinone/menaquinone biosynthesis C-methylase UbiE